MKKVEKLNKKIEKLKKKVARVEKTWSRVRRMNDSVLAVVLANLGVFIFPELAYTIPLSIIFSIVIPMLILLDISLILACMVITSQVREYLFTNLIKKICDFKIDRAEKKIKKLKKQLNEITDKMKEFNITDESELGINEAIKDLQDKEKIIQEKEQELERLKKIADNQKKLITRLTEKKQEEKTKEYNTFMKRYKNTQSQIEENDVVEDENTDPLTVD